MPLNIYKAAIYYNDGEDNYLVDWAIVYAHDESEARRILIEDGPDREWVNSTIEMIAWATAEPIPSIIVMSENDEIN